MSKKREDLKQINMNAAGIDVGSEMHYVAVPEDRAEQSIRKFSCYTADLHEMAEWLKECGITTVAMESTGVYWIPVFDVLESKGFEVILVNAHHIKNVPGRKTDVSDSRWIQQLHTYGLLHGSYQPENIIRKMRTYMRQKNTLIKLRSTHTQRMQKSLIQMNIQLHKVLSDMTGQTGMMIIRSILQGERDPLKLAQMKNSRVKSSEEIIAKSLEGNYQEEHLFCLKQELDQYDYVCGKIEECEKMIYSVLNKMHGGNDSDTDKDNSNKNRRLKLEAICDVDLTLIDGLDVNSVEAILSEVGIDMSKWPTEKHFGSWLGLCPNNKISGGKILSKKTRKVVSRASVSFRLAAFSVANSKSAMGAYYRRLRSRIGAPKAITATANKIARVFYKCMKLKISYTDLGADYYEAKYKERVLKNMKKRALDFGFELIPV